MISKISQKITERGAAQMLLLLLLTDGFFVVLHLLHKLPPVTTAIPTLRQHAFSISADLSLAESFQYIKEFWIALVLTAFAIKHRKPAYIGWILLFFFLVFDDMFAIHEGLGGLVGAKLSVPAFLSSSNNLRARDFGELIVSGAFGIFFLSLIFMAYLRGSAGTQVIFLRMLVLLMALVFFGVGVDFLDRFANSRILQEGLKLIEDGGEMVAMSFFCWYVITLPEGGQD